MHAILVKDVVTTKFACRLIGVTSFIILTALGAFVRIPLPFTPVPLTLQTMFVLLSGAFLGKRLGAFTQVLYLALGISGISVFSAAQSGWYYLVGPTGGYLLGFIAAAMFVGFFARLGKMSFTSIVVLFCIGDGIILGFGMLWLTLVLKYDLVSAFALGVMPFVVGDCLKVLIAATLYQRLQNRAREIF
ncbi:MAG: biotin transporter BioY [Candidatus Omnitrophica bacterium]|nr:biotin transporter BioY [Candidatus Omnitrophota bacterium]